MKVLFDQEVVVKIQNCDGKLLEKKLGLKIMKNDDVLLDKFEIELYDENKLDFLFRKSLTRGEYARIRNEQGIGEFEKLDLLIIDFIKEMESKPNDWLQIKHNSDGICDFELMSQRAVGYRSSSLLKLCLPKVSGDNLIQHLVSKAESFQTKWKELNSNNGELLIRLNNLAKEKKEIDKICKEQASKISSLTKEVENMKAEVEKLRTENQGLQDAAYEMEDDIKHLNDRVQELEDEVTFWKSKSEDYNLEVEVQIKQKERLEDENKKLERELHETQAVLDAVAQVGRKHEANLIKFEDELDKAIEDNKGLAEVNKRLKFEKNRAETAIAKYGQLLEEAEQKKKNLEDNVQSLKLQLQLKEEMLDLSKNC